MRPPSTPSALTTNSPWRRQARPSGPLQAATTGFTGWPAKCSRKWGLQAASKPQLAGRRGATAMPARVRVGTQAPSEPSLAQLPPPRASTVAAGFTSISPAGVAKRRAPSALQPSQRCRTWKATPSWRSRCSQARSRGAAFISVGKTRPEVPTKVSMPRPRIQARRASGPNSCSRGASRSRALP